MASQKISQFNVSTSLTDSDLFTFVVNSTNKTISYSDFKLSLGVTGVLNQAGNALAAPVLDKVGSDYNIRNIESGPGIITSISAENGVTLRWDIDQDTTGVPIVENLSNPKPDIASLVAGQGLSITKTENAITLTNTVDPATGLSNRVVVTQASDFSGTIDSTKEYFLDGIVDMTGSGIEIEVPVNGINISGYNFDLSKLICSDDNYTLFKSPVGGSGDMIGKDYAIEVTGANSKVYNVTDATGMNAFEFARINYNDCTSLGTITDYRQGLEVGTGRFGGKPELTLAGTWLGGYFIDTSIVRNLDDGAYSLFAAGAAFVMSSRFRSNQNIDLPASASFVDFAASNFVNPSTLQLEGCLVSREGVFDASDSNVTPNISASELVCDWMGNNGIENTFIGGELSITAEVTTTITTPGVFADLEGTYTSSDLQHFDEPSNGQLRHLGDSPVEYSVGGQFVLDSSSNDEVDLKIVIFRDATTSFEDGKTLRRVINNLQGGRDVAYFVISDNITLNKNDYVKTQVANVGDTNDITAEIDSFFIVSAR